MNQYDELLWAAANRYHVHKEMRESENEWKTRLVYSICGLMAYASIWDDSDAEPISIVHLKRKVRSMLSSYRAMYPELSDSLPYNPEELENEIANLFISTGIVYHQPYRIAPSMKREEHFDHILFQRGIALDAISRVSGIGFYSRKDKTANPLAGIKAMFGLEQKTLRDVWASALSSASWETDLSFDRDTEYLRLRPPFSKGYWEGKPDMTGKVSILRTGMEGSQLYYLYRCSGGAMEASPLQQWQVKSGNYRLLACACLLSHNNLPSIKFSRDGTLVHIHLDYLLPPRELGFLKLYSWPETCTTLPCDFNRKLATEVFEVMKSILSDAGYKFEETQTDA